MTIEELAELCIIVLDAQQRYFRTRLVDDLIASKKLEQHLRKTATAVLAA